MKQGSQIRSLSDVKKICSVQRMDIEMQVERSNVHVRSLETKRNAEGKTLKAHQEGWRQAVSGLSFELAAASAWSTEILHTEAEIERIAHDIQEAKIARQDLTKAQTAATARCDAVDDLLRSAQRAAQRQRDEALFDQHLSRALTGWRSACE